MRRWTWLQSITVLSTLVVAGCGGNASPVSPTASSASPSQDALAAKGSKPDPTAPTAPTNPGQSKTEIEGLIATIQGASITVNGQVVDVPPTAIIRHGSRTVLFSELQVGDRVHVKATLQGTALEAIEVRVQNPVAAGDDPPADDGPGDDVDAIVQVAVMDDAGSEAAHDPGTFQLTRTATVTQPITLPLTVTYTLTGTAANGADYQSLPLTAVFLAGQTTVDVVVTPMSDSIADTPETVILTLTDATPYLLAQPVSGTVTISDATVQVAVMDDAGSEAAHDPGTFQLTRTATATRPVTLPLTVTYTLTGTATNGVDYQSLPLTAVFLAGQTTVDVVVTPMSDSIADTPETVILTVTDATPYLLAQPVSGTATISDATVQVAVMDDAGSEAAHDPGTFQLTRTATVARPVTLPLTVTYTLTGTATNGVDYQTLPLTATFLAGQTTVNVVVTPMSDSIADAPETVILTLTDATPYLLAQPASGTVTISELPAVTVTAFDPSASETGLSAGSFRFSRSGSILASLTVTYTVGGAALNGTDYRSLPLTVTITAGHSSATVVVTPIADGLVEGSEALTVTVTDTALYDVGTPASATVTISD